MGHPDHRNFTDLPSWVPDLSNLYLTRGLANNFSACVLAPSSAYPIRRTISPAGELRLFGFKLDTIMTIVKFPDVQAAGFGEALLAFMASMPVIYPHKHASHPNSPGSDDPSITSSGQQRAAVLVHTLIAGKHSAHARCTPTEAQQLRAHFRAWLHVILGQAYWIIARDENGDEYDRMKTLKASVEALIGCLSSKEGENGPALSLIPTSARAKGPWRRLRAGREKPRRVA